MTSPTPALPTALQAPGFAVPGRVQANLTEPALIEAALARGEGQLGQGGAFLVSTGQFTGRSPKDKYIVRTAEVEPLIWWENNQPMSPAHFAQLHADMQAHLQGRECFVQDLCAGADPALRLDLRMVTELAWHGLFMRHMLRVPDPGALADFKPQWTIVNCPSFRADPLRHGCRSETVIALNFTDRLVLIGGTGYAGENKKAVFTILNYLLPGQDVLPMHCAANHAPGDPDDVAIFFGLSGTGKTSLSAAPDRVLIGDDEHGWSARGVFNFEGGCYAKTLNLSPQAEPQIHAATMRFASVVENMVFDPQTRALDFADGSLSENTRCAYPLQAISNASRTGMGGAPRHVVLLTCDAFGVLPPIARLTPAQAMYHFLSGFTARTPGTERGVVAPVPVFSACFGAPFMPRRPEVYGAMLQRRIAESGAACWLVNTGWTGGAHGTGQRMPIAATRRVLDAALSGALGKGRFRKDPVFGFEVPRSVPGLDPALLTPRATWADPAAYDAQAARLVAMFSDNFAQYLPFMDAEVRAAAIG